MLRKWKLMKEAGKSDNGEVILWYEGTAYDPPDELKGYQLHVMVADWATKKRRTESERKLAEEFLKRFPDGNQFNYIAGIKGRPKKVDTTIVKTLRVPKEFMRRIKGQFSKFVIQAIKEKLERDDKL